MEKLSELIDCDLKQILSFGDMINDLPMLKVTTGVAMGNAAKEVLDEIPLKTGIVNSTGIYQFSAENGLI